MPAGDIHLHKYHNPYSNASRIPVDLPLYSHAVGQYFEQIPQRMHASSSTWGRSIRQLPVCAATKMWEHGPNTLRFAGVLVGISCCFSILFTNLSKTFRYRTDYRPDLNDAAVGQSA